MKRVDEYQLPASMKRPGVQLPPQKPLSPECSVPAWLLAFSCVCLMFFAIAFHPYPELLEPGFWRWMAGGAPILLIAAAFGWVMAVSLAFLAVIMRWSRFRNAVVLLLCCFAPLLSLLLGAGMKYCLCPAGYVW